MDQDLQSIQQVRDLVAQAKEAQWALAGMDQAQLDRITAAVSRAGAEHARELAQMAVVETGFGVAEHKEIKNRFAAVTVYEAIRELKTVGVLARDSERRTMDLGVPVGIVAALVPSTNPTSTVFYKTLICLKAGNPVIFSPHPNALKCITEAVRVAAQAAQEAGAPAGAVSCITHPTLEATQALMSHRDTRMILATGGGAMVKAAYSSGTPAIGVGAGNGPAYIHKSANVAQAVKHILASKTFDNGTICASEQSILVEKAMEEEVKGELRRQGAYLLRDAEGDKLAKFILRPNGTMNPAIVGKSVETIARLAGLDGVPPSARVLVARETGVGKGHPFSSEKLAPILGFYVEEDEQAVFRRSVEILAWEGAGHTYAIHAQDEDLVRRLALAVPASRVLVNTPAALGGIGATTGLFPALTLGCGAVGGSSSSNNIGPLDLIDIKRVAWGVREPETGKGGDEPWTQALCCSSELMETLVQEICKRLR
jgi:acetaldehyde dehydrogenase (acetylating)